MKPNVRVIVRLEAKGPNLVKGLCFDGFRVLGHPEAFARIYDASGADEFFYVDTVASLYRRPPGLEVIRRVAAETTVPLTVAGGIRTMDDIVAVLHAGADKVAINTAAIGRPEFFREASDRFGAQCIVASIEAHRNADRSYECWTDFGRQRTGIDVFDWARRAVDLGAGEIVLSAVHEDGMGGGFDVELTRRIATEVPVPVVAACGAGRKEHFAAAVTDGCADAVSAAGIFHYEAAAPVDAMWMSYDGEELRRGQEIDSGNIEFLNAGYGGVRDIMVEPTTIAQVKEHLAANGIPVRMTGELPAVRKGAQA